jgi:protein SHQ1
LITFPKAAKNDWRLPQTVSVETPSTITTAKRGYGFLEMHNNYFRHAVQTPNEVNELGELAETASAVMRLQIRTAHEDAKWDEEYYM